MNHFPRNPGNVERGSPQAVNARRSDCLLLDVRTPVEFESAKIGGAVLRSMGGIDPEEVATLAGERGEVVLICQSGSRAKKVAAQLAGKLAVPVTVLKGGLQAWEAAGLPLTRSTAQGRAVISLERQVRIVAGSLVLLGTVLGVGVHAGFLALAAFVGAGLIFAGVTDTCGMGLFLARMPWNRACGKGCAIKSE